MAEFGSGDRLGTPAHLVKWSFTGGRIVMEARNLQKNVIIDRFQRSLIELLRCEEWQFAKGDVRTATKREITTITKLQHHKTPNQFTDRRITRKYVKTQRINLTPPPPLLFASIAYFNHKWRENKVPLICCETHALPLARQAYIAITEPRNSILIIPLALTKWILPHRLLHTSISIPTPHVQTTSLWNQAWHWIPPSSGNPPPPPRICLHYSPTVEGPIFWCPSKLFFSNSKFLPKGDNGRSDDMGGGVKFSYQDLFTNCHNLSPPPLVREHKEIK